LGSQPVAGCSCRTCFHILYCVYAFHRQFFFVCSLGVECSLVCSLQQVFSCPRCLVLSLPRLLCPIAWFLVLLLAVALISTTSDKKELQTAAWDVCGCRQRILYLVQYIGRALSSIS
jgi:hypothetical protein